jgi:membrane fusion protein, copper/silver efflux system
MKKINWIIMALLLGAAIPAMTGCKTSEPAASVSHAVQYTCPMHPQIVRDAPGNCPICGMTLVEKH